MSSKSSLALIEPLLEDPQVTEILIDNHESVYVEKQGQFHDVSSPFQSETQVFALIKDLTQPLGVTVDESRPFVDLRLPDDSRVNIVIPPIALRGPSITLRKMLRDRITLEMLLEYNCLSPNMATFIEHCVLARCNILISGGVGSGKTTLLNIVGRMIPLDERLIVINNFGWSSLDHKRLVSLESRPPNIEGKGEINTQSLVENAMRMRPDRILVSDVHGDEAFNLILAMNSGHDGTLIDLHASNPRDAIDRFEMMATIGNPSMPLLAVRQQIASAINLIIHQERLADGSRKVITISEVTGMEGSAIKLSDIFQFHETGTQDGRITGLHKPTGMIPSFFPILQDLMGTDLAMFTP